MSDELNNQVNLVLGDWSGDGHSVTDTVVIRSNLTKKEIENAYKEGARKLEVDVDDDVATEYADSTLEKKDWEKFASAGMTLKELFDGDESDIDDATEYLDSDDEDCSFDVFPDSFARLWLFTVKVGNPEFKYSIIEDDSDTINIGGYGLFGN